MYKLLTCETKEDAKRRVTCWQESIDLPWLIKQKAIAEKNGKRFEIMKREHDGKEQFALFYSDGYYKFSEKYYRFDWIEIGKDGK